MTIDDELACERLCHDYAITNDAADFPAFVALFMEGAVLDLPGRLMRGRGEMMETLSKRRPTVVTMHVYGSVRITVTGANTATGVAYVTFYRYERENAQNDPAPIVPPTSLGIYHDEFVRTDEGWRFKKRRLQPVFRQA